MEDFILGFCVGIVAGVGCWIIFAWLMVKRNRKHRRYVRVQSLAKEEWESGERPKDYF